MTSGVHRAGRIDFTDPHARHRRYSKWAAYAQSKLANLLFTTELRRRAEAAGVDLRPVAAHPGYAATNLQAAGARMAGRTLVERGVNLVNGVLGQSDRAGALPSLRAATDPGVRAGEVYGPDRFFEMRGHPVVVQVSAGARDEADAARLWALSEEATGVRYPLG